MPMLNVLLAGLTPRDAAAVEMLIGMAWSDARVERADRDAVTAAAGVGVLANADVCVVDLAGMGWGRWSAGHEANLLQMLRGRAAVALVPPGDGGGWLAVRHGGIVKQTLEWVSKPCSTVTLRHALDRVKAAWRDRTPAAPALPPLAPPAATPRGPGLGLSPSERATLLATFPTLRANPFLELLLRLVGSAQPQELRLDPRHALIIHPPQGWVAGNVSQAVLLRLLRFDPTAAAFQFTALAAAEATERSLHLGRHQALEDFVWRLAGGAFDLQPLMPAHNLVLRLHRMPDLVWLQEASELNLQLAALCLRAPQTLRGLMKHFAHEPAAVVRFTLCAVLAGMASIEPLSAARAEAAAAAANGPAPPPARPGFLRALLARLF